MKKIMLLLAFLAAGCGSSFTTTTMQDMQNEQEKQIAKDGEGQLERMGFVGGKAIRTKSGQVVQSTVGYHNDATTITRSFYTDGSMYFEVYVNTCSIVLFRDPQGRFYWERTNETSGGVKVHKPEEAILSATDLDRLLGDQKERCPVKSENSSPQITATPTS
ncbi:MAG TPA: hypothetical protein VFZ48_05005 [Candidatus Saccharimonadales bacterium]